MNKSQAFGVISQAVNIANKRGAFDLKDAALIFKALEVLSIDYPDKPIEGDVEEVTSEKEE